MATFAKGKTFTATSFTGTYSTGVIYQVPANRFAEVYFHFIENSDNVHLRTADGSIWQNLIGGTSPYGGDTAITPTKHILGPGMQIYADDPVILKFLVIEYSQQ